MDLQHYCVEAHRTTNHNLTDSQHRDNFALGAIGELGELADHWKKHLHQGHPLQPDKLINEAGDLCWYLAGIINFYAVQVEHETQPIELDDPVATLLGLQNQINAIVIEITAPNPSLPNLGQRIRFVFGLLAGLVQTPIEEIYDRNINKLRLRYPDAFTTDASINRIDD